MLRFILIIYIFAWNNIVIYGKHNVTNNGSIQYGFLVEHHQYPEDFVFALIDFRMFLK